MSEILASMIEPPSNVAIQSSVHMLVQLGALSSSPSPPAPAPAPAPSRSKSARAAAVQSYILTGLGKYLAMCVRCDV